ncbi:MAG: hypothetical protein VXZ25_05460, partial [Pseudomonadota bacterium]|nr:hypothetical protein [Pseudomonadota bacterium]
RVFGCPILGSRRIAAEVNVGLKQLEFFKRALDRSGSLILTIQINADWKTLLGDPVENQYKGISI